MRLPVPTPTVDPLPYEELKERSEETRVSVPLRNDAVARFDAFLHELNPDAPRADPDRIQRLANWLVTLPDDTASDVLDRRLRRITELRAMLDDPDWDADDATRARLEKLFGYIDRDDGLISDHEPLLGLLDDVLLIELAWPAFAEEAEEYRDFSAYRSDEHPVGSGDEQRAAWLQDRLAQIGLLQHQLRVSDSHYVHRGHPEELFRVG